MPGTHFTFTTLWGKEYHYPLFSGEETEAQRVVVACAKLIKLERIGIKIGISPLLLLIHFCALISEPFPW